MDFNNIKRFIISLLITILYSTLIFSIVDLFVEQPQYNDYCNTTFSYPIISNCTDVEPNNSLISECNNNGGVIEPIYKNGCIISYKCNTCSALYNQAIGSYSLKRFIVSTLLGVISIIVFLNIKTNKKIVYSIYSGFMIGGLIAVLLGTIGYFRYMSNIIRIITTIFEIIIIIFIALKTNR